MKNHYFKTKVKKMGKWALLPLDLDNWHAEYTSRYFKQIFGFGKGLLNFVTFYDGGFEHCYTPASYFKKLHKFIHSLAVKDYRALQKILKKFYPFRARLKEQIPKLFDQQVKKLSNLELVRVYKKNRDFPHRATAFDQFGWLAEDYWPPVEKKILMQKGLTPGSEEFHRVLFALIKPEEISTTLEEKRAVLKEAITVLQKKVSLAAASTKLSRIYGWMPVSAYGEPWGKEHYQKELQELVQRPLSKLKKEFQALVQYAHIRNRDIRDIIKQYRLTAKELQVFVDHSLVLDTRNEAEYLVSYCGYHVLPLYREISRRLGLSTRQLRSLYEYEVVLALQGKLDVQKVLADRRYICGYGFNKSMTKRFYFTTEESKKLFEHVEKDVQYAQGADESKGLCASPGKVKGTVKVVIKTPEDNKKVRRGDIMIAVCTMVDHLPAMKNAAAVITEVGGLTCHAAVVSREFGIPCIVGLKNATKNFKDGDRVEVDSGKGIVRKL